VDVDAAPAPPSAGRRLRPALRRGLACFALGVPALAGLFSVLCLSLPDSASLVADAGTGSGFPQGETLLALALADWGGIPVWPYVTPAQLAVRTAMADVARRAPAPPRAVLALGDNFYMAGVRDVDDPRFNSTFEAVYTQDHPELGRPAQWKVVAGNHDYGQNVSAQMAYTNRSRAWHFPSAYYSFRETVTPGVVVDFVMCDTVVLAAGSPWGLSGAEARAQGEAHWAWLERELAGSRADYLVVGGHYPALSVGHHGPTPGLSERLRGLLAAHNASAYLSGHDHCAQAFLDGAVEHHGVGGAHLLDPFAPNKGSVPEGSLRMHYGGSIWPANVYKGAFAAISVAEDGGHMTITHIDSDGRTLFSSRVPPRRGSPRGRRREQSESAAERPRRHADVDQS